MKVRRVLTFAIIVALVGIAWATVSVQSSAASPDTEADVMGIDTLAAMHAACGSNNADAMRGTMESLTGEDWDAMGSHMGSGMMSSGMMGAASHETTTMDMRRW